MADQRIGAAFVEVATKGLAKVQSDLNFIKGKLTEASGAGKQLDDATKKSGESAQAATKSFQGLAGVVNSIGAIATKSFFGGIAAISGFVRMADPRGFENLEVALAKLGIQLGRFFVPLLREATEWIERLAGWFKGLSDSQRESVLLFTKIALGIALVLMIIPKLLAAFQLVSMAIAALGAETAIASGGLTVLLGVLAAAIPALLALFGATSGAGGLSGIFEKIGPAIQQLVDVFKNAFGQIVQVVTQVLDKLLPVVTTVIGVIAQVVGGLVNAFMKGIQPIIPIVLTIVDQVGQIFGMLAPLFGKLVETVGPILEKIIGVYARLYAAFYGVFSKILGAVMQILPPIIDVISSLFEVVGSVLTPVLDLISEQVKAVVDSMLPIIEGLLSALVPVINTIVEVFKTLVEVAKPLIEAYMEVWKLVQELIIPVFQVLASIIAAAVTAVAAMFKALAEVLIPVIRFIAGILTPVVKALADGIISAVGAIKRVINGLIDFMNGFIEWYNDQDLLPGKLTKINRIGEDGGAGGAGDYGGDDDKKKDDKGKKKEDGDKFRGEAKVPPAQLVGIAEAWKKVQTSQQDDVASRLARETLEESKGIRRAVEGIDKKTKPVDPWAGPGGDF